MKKLWPIPAAFFAVCCILNLTGCLLDGNLERFVKPALMPLLCLTTMTYILEFFSGAVRYPERRYATPPTPWAPPSYDAEGGTSPDTALRRRKTSVATALLMCGQLFGFAGDTMLLGKGFPFFAGGIGCFLVGHIFYISLFGSRSWKGLRAWQWIVALTLCLLLVVGLVIAIGVKGVMLAPMGIYGFVLALLIFSTLAGAIRFGGPEWWMLAAGSVLFTFSDALIAVRNFGTLSPFMDGFGVMSTYLAAQSLLAAGAARLICQGFFVPLSPQMKDNK